MKSMYCYSALIILYLLSIAFTLSAQERPVPSVRVDAVYSNGFVVTLSPILAIHQVQVATDSAFTSLVFTNQLISTSVCDRTTTIVNNLQTGKRYYIRARIAGGATEDNSQPGGYRPAWGAFSTTLTITLPQESQPSRPTLAGTTNVTHEKLTLLWQTSLGNPSLYEVELALDTTFRQIIKGASVKDTSVTFVGLASNTQYFYRIRARNNNGFSEFSSVDIEQTLMFQYPFTVDKLIFQQNRTVQGTFFYIQNKELSFHKADSIIAFLISKKIPINEAWFRDTTDMSFSLFSINLNVNSSPFVKVMEQYGFSNTERNWLIGCYPFVRYYRNIVPLFIVKQTNSNNIILSPNPASNIAAINFSLSSPTNLRVEVTDMLGRSVLPPFSEERGAGEQSIPFSVEGLSSGVYSVRLTVQTAAGVRSETVRLVVVR
jgi:Secretion system C-terminal sorting domain/Fibronectin type III domain